MYFREQNPMFTEFIETPPIDNETQYDLFRSQTETIKMYETHSHLLSIEMLPPVVLYSRPQKTKYIGKKSVFGILGYDLWFTDV